MTSLSLHMKEYREAVRKIFLQESSVVARMDDSSKMRIKEIKGGESRHEPTATGFMLVLHPVRTGNSV